MAVAEARAPDTARTEGEERLDDLIGHAVWVLPGVEPDVEAHAHVGKAYVADGRGKAHEEQRQEDIGLAPRRHVRHEYGNAKEEQCRAEVLLHDEHQHRDAPDADERRDEAQRRQLQEEQAALRQG